MNNDEGEKEAHLVDRKNDFENPGVSDSPGSTNKSYSKQFPAGWVSARELSEDRTKHVHFERGIQESEADTKILFNVWSGWQTRKAETEDGFKIEGYDILEAITTCTKDLGQYEIKLAEALSANNACPPVSSDLHAMKRE